MGNTSRQWQRQPDGELSVTTSYIATEWDCTPYKAKQRAQKAKAHRYPDGCWRLSDIERMAEADGVELRTDIREFAGDEPPADPLDTFKAQDPTIRDMRGLVASLDSIARQMTDQSRVTIEQAKASADMIARMTQQHAEQLQKLHDERVRDIVARADKMVAVLQTENEAVRREREAMAGQFAKFAEMQFDNLEMARELVLNLSEQEREAAKDAQAAEIKAEGLAAVKRFGERYMAERAQKAADSSILSQLATLPAEDLSGLAEFLAAYDGGKLKGLAAMMTKLAESKKQEGEANAA